jgi:hypothetical protein
MGGKRFCIADLDNFLGIQIWRADERLNKAVVALKMAHHENGLTENLTDHK